MTTKRPSKTRPLAQPKTTRIKPGVTRTETEERIGLRRERKSVTQYEFGAFTAETFREAFASPDRRAALLGYLTQLERVARAVCKRADISWTAGPWPTNARPAKNTAPSVAIELLKDIHVLRTALARAERHIEQARTAKDKVQREAALNAISGMLWEVAADADDVRQSYERLAELAVPSPDDPAGRTPVELVKAAIATSKGRSESVPWWLKTYRDTVDGAIEEAAAQGRRLAFMDLWKQIQKRDIAERTAADRRDKPLPAEPGMRSAIRNAAAAGILTLPTVASRN